MFEIARVLRVVVWPMVLSSGLWGVAAGLIPQALFAQEDKGLLRGHEGAVMMGLFTPDGQGAVTVSTDQTARLWDLSTGKVLRQYAQHTGPIYCLGISGDGSILATGAQDNQIKVWSLPLRDPVEILAPRSKAVLGITLTPEGNDLLAVSADQTFTIYEVGNAMASPAGGNKPAVGQPRSGHDAEVLAVACRNDAAYYATSDAKGRIILWSPYLKEPLRILQGNEGRVTSLTFTGNNQQLVTAGDDGCVRLWQMLPSPSRVIPGLSSEVIDLDLLTNSAAAIVVFPDGKVSKVPLSEGQEQTSYPAQTFRLRSMARAPNNTWVALGGETGQAAIVDANNGAPRGTVAGHRGPINDVVVHADNIRFATAGADGTIRLWQQPQAETLVKGHTAALQGLVSSHNGQWFATIADDRSIRIWDANGALRRQLNGHEHPPRVITVRDDDALLASGDQSGTVRAWNPANGAAQGVLTAHKGAVTALAFSADRKQLITAGEDHLVRAWTLPLPAKLPAEGEEPVQPAWEYAVPANNTLIWLGRMPADAGYAGLPTGGAQIIRIKPDGTAINGIPSAGRPLTFLSGSPDGKQLLGVDDQGQGHIWDLQGTLLRSVPLGPGTVSARFHKDGTELITADKKNRIRIHDARTGQVREELPCSQVLRDAVWLGTDFRHVAAMGMAADAVVLRRALLRLLEPPSEKEASPQTAWDEVTDLVMTPDQQHLLACRKKSGIEQWKLSDGTLVRKFQPEQGEILRVALSPNGQRVVGTSGDQQLFIWTWNDGQLERTFSLPAEAHDLVISPDSTRAATAHEDGNVRIWDLASGLLLQTLSGHVGKVRAVRFLSDGRSVVSAGVDKTVHVSPLSVMRTIPVDLAGPIRSMVLYNNGTHAISATSDGRVLMTDLNAGTIVRQFRVRKPVSPEASAGEAEAAAGEEKTEPESLLIQPTAVACRGDNQRIAAGTQAGEVFLWNANNGEDVIASFTLGAAIKAIQFSPDNGKLAALTVDGKLQIFGASIPGALPQLEWTLHQEIDIQAPVTALQFSRDSQSLWIAQASGEIKRWKYAAPGQIRQFNQGGAVYGVAVSRDGETMVSCGVDQSVRVWNIVTGQQRYQLRGHQGPVHAVAMSPDEVFAVSSGADGTLRLWDIVGGRQLKELIRYDATMYSVAIHPQGKQIAAAGADRKIHLLDLITGAEQRVLEGHTDYIHSVQFSSDGKRILSYGYAGYLKIWNSSDGRLLHESRPGRVGNSASFSPDGKSILLCNGDGTARLLPAP